MCDSLSATLIGVLGTLLGVYIGWVLNRKTVNDTIKQQEFYKAAAAFRAAFVEEYRALKAVVHKEDMEATFVQSTLSKATAKHEIACILFRPYLSDKRKQQLDQAWRQYLCPEGGELAELPSLFIDYYRESQLNISINLALNKLDKIMEFAEPESK